MENRRIIFGLIVLLILTIQPAYSQFDLEQAFNRPNDLGNIHGITVDPANGHVYISDFQNVHHFDENMEHIEVINFNIGTVRGLGFDSDANRLLLANYGQGRYAVADLEGEVLELVDANANLNTISYDSDRELYIIGDWNRRVLFFNRDNEMVSQFNVGVNITGICYYPINGTVFVLDTNDPMLEYSVEGELLERPMPNDVINGNGQDIGYDSMNRLLYATGQGGWVGQFNDNYGAVAEPEYDPEEFQIQVPIGQEMEETLVIRNVGEEGSVLTFSIEEIGGEPDWLIVEPVDGSVEEGDAIEISLTITTEELEPGQFGRTLSITTNSPEFREAEIPIELMVIADYGELQGVVTDAATGDPVVGANVSVNLFDLETQTDEDGEYRFEEIPEWVYTVFFTADDFLPMQVEEVEIIADEITELNVEMLHSRCELSIDAIHENLPPNEMIEVDFTLANPGNGTLEWQVERVFPEGMDVEPWTNRGSFPAAEIVDNNRLGGVEFVDDHFYVAGGVRGEDNLIYVLDREGELVDQFPQFSESNYGMRDLTFDGSLLWGTDEGMIYGFTTEGELVEEFESPMDARCIAYDPVNENMAICNITTDLMIIDMEGGVIREIDRPGFGPRIYGLAYYPDDPDGYSLYMFCGNGEQDRDIYKLDPESGETEFVVTPDIEGEAGAATITNRWDPRSWVFISLTRSDAIEILHIAAPTGWTVIEPVEGTVEVDSETDMTVALNSQSLPLNLEFTAEFVFTHNGRGGETILPVSVMATEGGVHTDRTLNLNIGWNMVSVNVDPDERDVRVLTADLVENDLLDLMKNGMGNFYNPEFNFNNIPGWFVDEGYLIKVGENCELTIEGVSVNPDDPIDLADGWNMIAYYPRIPINAITAFSGIAEQLIIAKDGQGRFYVPDWDFSNMGDLREGQGYLVKMDGEAELIYQMREEIASNNGRNNQPSFLPGPSATDKNMSFLAICDENLSSMDNAEIGIYAGGLLVGSGKFDDGMCGAAIWGDDPTTETIDGALENQELTLKLFDGERSRQIECVNLSGEGKYDADGLWIIELESKLSIPENFEIASVHPNPFNSATQVHISMPERGTVEINLYDVNGRLIKQVAKTELAAGANQITLDANELAVGVYLLEASCSGRRAVEKIAVLK